MHNRGLTFHRAYLLLGLLLIESSPVLLEVEECYRVSVAGECVFRYDGYVVGAQVQVSESVKWPQSLRWYHVQAVVPQT